MKGERACNQLHFALLHNLGVESQAVLLVVVERILIYLIGSRCDRSSVNDKKVRLDSPLNCISRKVHRFSYSFSDLLWRLHISNLLFLN